MYAIRSYYEYARHLKTGESVESFKGYSHRDFRITSYNVCYTKLLRLSKSGEELWFNSYIYPEFDDNGKISGYVALRHNITDKKKLEKLNLELEDRIQERTKELEISNGKLQELSRTDPLTKVFNRRYFEEKVMIEIRNNFV